MSLQASAQGDFELIATLIEESRLRAFSKVNEELVFLYFRVGDIVSRQIAKGKWGDGTVGELSAFLATKYPSLSGFNRRGLYRMRQFYETYSVDSECFELWNSTQASIVSPLATQLDQVIVSPAATQLEGADNQHENFMKVILAKLTWSHHLEIFSACPKAEQKLFYLMTTVSEKWGKLELRRQIQSALFERTMLGHKMAKTVLPALPKDIFKDPYVFEFLELPDGHSEKDLERALVLNLQKFILEIGRGFAYMGSQFRIQVGNKDYHTDLLFYHRDLQCLVLFELKVEEFQPEFLGKLNFYLEALDRDVRREHEQPSIGILLCKGKDTEVVEYSLARSTSPAMVADYETKLIPRDLLARKLSELAERFASTKA